MSMCIELKETKVKKNYSVILKHSGNELLLKASSIKGVYSSLNKRGINKEEIREIKEV